MKNIYYITLYILLISTTFVISSCQIFKVKHTDPPKKQTPDKTEMKKPIVKGMRIGALKLGKFVYKASVEKEEGFFDTKIFREVKFQFGNIIITEDVYNSTERTTDRFVIDSISLLPYSRVYSSGIEEIINVKFSSSSIEGNILLPSGVTPFSRILQQPVFSDGFSIDLAITLLPLSVGYKTKLSYYDFKLDDIRNINVEVATMELYPFGNESIDCYRVFVTDEENGTIDTYWISADEYPKIIKADIQVISDYKKRSKTYELIETINH
ncbi:MAG: hypothetical protein N2490_06945 [Ignavibacteria bacterium]|nr:hypothetical protein [Ignavibacteria bacterium]